MYETVDSVTVVVMMGLNSESSHPKPYSVYSIFSDSPVSMSLIGSMLLASPPAVNPPAFQPEAAA
jgi:hypothetical protein